MRVAFFDTHGFERPVFAEENRDFHHEITHFEVRLSDQTAALAAGYPVVCAFVNDRLGSSVLEKLSSAGTRLIALRCAGFNHVDLEAAAHWGIRVVRVPEYSPHAVAEHAVALILSLDRKLHRAHARVREGNFSLEGLVGFDLYGKTVGVVGTGRIGAVFAKIMLGFGCRVLAYDRVENPDLVGQEGLRYAELAELLRESQVISLHVPLTPATHHLIDARAIQRMRDGVMIINTGRGALIDTQALVHGLKSGKVGSAGLDVYEEEEGVFFEDLSDQVIQDDTLARLLTFPNVLLTSHQAFLTAEALSNIASTTLRNISDFEMGAELVNEVTAAANLRKSSG